MIKRIADVPRVTDGEPDDPDWHPLTHHFGLTAFGLNAFVARDEGQELVGEHDEQASGQEEVYVVTTGRARFWLDGWAHDVDSGYVVVAAPAVRRRAVALEPGTTVLAIGGPPRDEFVSTWQNSHFEGVARADDTPTLEP